MKKIKVYLQYPWKVSDSQYYKNLLEFPPEGVEYIFSESNRTGIMYNKRKFRFIGFVKRIIRKVTHGLGLEILNIRKSPSNINYDLIHCAHCLSSNNSPWVADFESSWQMLVSDHGMGEGREKVLNVLGKKNCKNIIAWTNSAKEDILKKYPEIKDKVEVLFYAMPLPKIKKKKTKDIGLLFLGRYFRRKGGLHTLEAFDRLTKKYPNVTATIVSSVPEKIKEKYSFNKKIKICDLMPYEKVIEEVYPSSDIFIYPGYSDTFGFSFVEALAFGLPIITVDGFARREIIENGKTGFIISLKNKLDYDQIGKNEEEVVREIVKRASSLIENHSLRKKMSLNCRNVVKKGKFSIINRNNKLKKIYEGAIKDD